VSKELICRGGDNDVVHIQQDVGEVRSMLVDEERYVRLRSNKAEAMREMGEPLIPHPRGLLEAVQ
jgi:hypothetical protein